MLINVPQYIDVEDKIAGPLTAKQLGWMIALGVILLILWNVVPGALFFILAIPIALIFTALAFYRPYGQPLGGFVVFGFMYLFKPKIYLWRRTPNHMIDIPQKAQVAKVQTSDKHLTQQSLKDLATMLDSEGVQYNEKLEEVLKKMPIKKV